MGKFEERGVRNHIKSILDGSIKEIINKALGIEKDPWRTGYRLVENNHGSPLHEAIRRLHSSTLNPNGGVAKELIERAVKNWAETVVLSPEEIKAIREAYRNSYIKTLLEKAKTMAIEQAEADVTDLIARLDQENVGGSP